MKSQIIHILLVSIFICGSILGNENPNPTYKKIKIKRGTIVTLELAEVLDSYIVEEGQTVKMELYLDVKVDSHKVANTGVSAFGRISSVRSAGIFGKSAVIELEAGYLQTIDGQVIPLKGSKVRKRGKSRQGLAWGVSVIVPAIGLAAGSPAFLIFAASGFFIKGKDIEIPSGTIMTAKVASDIEIYVPTE
jgi:hypothetical protein